MELTTHYMHAIPGLGAISKFLRCAFFLCSLQSTSLAQNYELISSGITYHQPKLVFDYIDPRTGFRHNITLDKKQTRSNEDYAGNAKGVLRLNSNQGCSDYPNFSRKKSWVAFLKRTGGRCKESEKIRRAQAANASAVILYTGDKDELNDVDIASKYGFTYKFLNCSLMSRLLVFIQHGELCFC